MKLFHLLAARRKGSVLVFSLLILSIMLVTALTILSSALLNQKAALSTGNSARSFQVADSGVERVLYQIYKANHNRPSDIASAVGGSCSNGVISFDIVGGRAEVTLYRDATTILADCNDATWRDKISKIKSEGSAGSTARAVEVAVASRFNCSGSPKTLALSMAGMGSPAHPRGVAFDTETNSIWVTAGVASTIDGVVIKIDPVTMTEIGRYPVGQNPRGIVYDPYTKSMWVANYSNRRVNRIDVRTGAIVGPSYVVGGGDPIQIAYDPDTKSVWTANYDVNAKNISRVSTATGLGANYATTQGGNIGIAYDTHTKSIWTTNWNDGTTRAYRYNAATDTLTQGPVAWPCGAASIGSNVYDPTTKSIWVACFDKHWVRKVDVTNGSVGPVIDITPYTSSPWGIAVDERNARIWAAGTGGPLAKIDIPSQTFLGNVTNPNLTGGYHLAIETYTNSVWVVNTDSNSITKVCLNS